MKLLTPAGLRDTPAADKAWQEPDPPMRLADIATPSTDPAEIWKTQPNVRKVVDFAARQVASLPWKVYRLGEQGRDRVRDSATEKLLRYPTPGVDIPATRFRLVRDLVTDALLFDRYLAAVVDNSLVRIPPRRWKVTSDWLGRPAAVTLLPPEGFDPIPLEGVPMICGWGWNVRKAGGVSPLLTLQDILTEARQAVKWRLRQWDEAPKFGGLLKHPGSFRDKTKRDTFAESWREWREGRKGTPILEDGMEYTPPSLLSPVDALDLDGRKLSAVEVCSAFHIPPELVGAREGNFSNMQAYRSMLFGPTLGPLIEDLQEAANAALLPRLDPDPSLYIEIAREAAVNGSLVEQASVLQTMTGAPTMSRAEARDRLNLPHLEGTDELVVPLNVLIGGQASPTDSGSQNRKTPLEEATDANAGA